MGWDFGEEGPKREHARSSSWHLFWYVHKTPNAGWGYVPAYVVCQPRKSVGTDLVTLARLLGHTGLKVLQRYLKQLPEDLKEAHRRAGQVDNALLR